MTIRNRLLTLSIVLGCGLIIGGLAYAQEAPKAKDDSKFDFKFDDDFDFDFDFPDAPQGDRAFTFFLQGTFLGVHVEDISKDNMSSYGMREVRGVGVTEVVKDSPAEKAGLRKGDVILRFDGESVTSVRKLNRLVMESSPDQSVRLTISRAGSEQEISATLTKRNPMVNVMGREMSDEIRQKIEKGLPKIKDGDGRFVFTMGYRRIGISTQTLTKQLADYFGVTDGILVTSVNENSPAAKAGLKAGDIITAVDGEKVDSPGDVTRAMNKKQDGSVTLTVVRDRNSRSITVTPEKPPAGAGGAADMRTIVVPQIEIPAIPPITISTPRIVIPSTPPIQVTVPRRPAHPRVVII